jgi:hypothetical protein
MRRSITRVSTQRFAFSDEKPFIVQLFVARPTIVQHDEARAASSQIDMRCGDCTSMRPQNASSDFS